MRIPLVASLAWQDYRNDAWLSACSVLALVAVIAPLLPCSYASSALPLPQVLPAVAP